MPISPLDPVVAWTAWLAEPGLGPARAASWLRAHGSLEAGLGDLRRGRVTGVPGGLRGSVRNAFSDAALRRAEAAVASWRSVSSSLVALGTPGYPQALAELTDPPPLLFVRGAMPASLLAGPDVPRAVAVVGTRRATPWGRAFARDLGHDLAAADVVVVSGLALGIDAAAHRGALDGQRRHDRHGTVAVLAGGLDAVHPPAHHQLAERIAERGALLSEHPPGVRPTRGAFPRRNRIVAGLVAAVAVVEAPLRSGVRHTVEVASQAGRDVWVVPRTPDGDIGRAAARLLADGAAPLTGAADLIATLPSRSAEDAGDAGEASGLPWADRPGLSEDPVERSILARLNRDGASDVDALSDCGATLLAVFAALGRLEARRAIERDAVGRWRARER